MKNEKEVYTHSTFALFCRYSEDDNTIERIRERRYEVGVISKVFCTFLRGLKNAEG